MEPGSKSAHGRQADHEEPKGPSEAHGNGTEAGDAHEGRIGHHRQQGPTG
jgi:hypothetical protein